MGNGIDAKQKSQQLQSKFSAMIQSSERAITQCHKTIAMRNSKNNFATEQFRVLANSCSEAAEIFLNDNEELVAKFKVLSENLSEMTFAVEILENENNRQRDKKAGQEANDITDQLAETVFFHHQVPLTRPYSAITDRLEDLKRVTQSTNKQVQKAFHTIIDNTKSLVYALNCNLAILTGSYKQNSNAMQQSGMHGQFFEFKRTDFTSIPAPNEVAKEQTMPTGAKPMNEGQGSPSDGGANEDNNNNLNINKKSNAYKRKLRNIKANKQEKPTLPIELLGLDAYSVQLSKAGENYPAVLSDIKKELIALEKSETNKTNALKEVQQKKEKIQQEIKDADKRINDLNVENEKTVQTGELTERQLYHLQLENEAETKESNALEKQENTLKQNEIALEKGIEELEESYLKCLEEFNQRKEEMSKKLLNVQSNYESMVEARIVQHNDEIATLVAQLQQNLEKIEIMKASIIAENKNEEERKETYQQKIQLLEAENKQNVEREAQLKKELDQRKKELDQLKKELNQQEEISNIYVEKLNEQSTGLVHYSDKGIPTTEKGEPRNIWFQGLIDAQTKYCLAMEQLKEKHKKVLDEKDKQIDALIMRNNKIKNDETKDSIHKEEKMVSADHSKEGSKDGKRTKVDLLDDSSIPKQRQNKNSNETNFKKGAAATKK